LAELLSTLDRSVAGKADGFEPEYFVPEFFTYLRRERPQYWLDTPTTLIRLTLIPAHMLALIQPDDALWAAETWPIGSGTFATNFLAGHNIHVDLADDPLPRLRRFVAESSED